MEVVQNSGIGDAFYITNPGGVPLLVEPRSLLALAIHHQKSIHTYGVSV